MNSFVNPYDSQRNLFENATQIVNERDFLRNANSQLASENNNLQLQIASASNAYNAVVERANGMHQADMNTINQLTGIIASLKADRELSARKFETDGYGNASCIEPSRKKREIGYIKFYSCHILVATVYNRQDSFLVMEYGTDIGNTKKVVIPFSDISKKKLTDYFTFFRYKCSKEIANDFLCFKLFEIIALNPPVISMPEFPGIEISVDSKGLASATFTCCEQKLPVEYEDAVSVPYYEKFLPAVKSTANTIINNLADYINVPETTAIICFGLIGILSPYLRHIHCDISELLVVSCSSTDGEMLASCLMKTYSREKPPKSLTSGKYELNSFLEESYGETVVFNDDTVSENRGKRVNSLDTILGFHSNNNCNPFNVAVISKEAQYIIPNTRSIIIEVNDAFGKNLTKADRYRLSSVLDEMTRYFAECFCKHIDEYGSIMESTIKSLSSEYKEDFSSVALSNSFSVMYAVYLVWTMIFNIRTTVDFKSYLRKLIINSQDFETGKENLIVNTFFKILSRFIAENRLSVKKLDRMMKYERGTDTVIIDGDIMLMEESVVKKLFLPEITEAQTVNSILSALSKKEFLVSTNGHKKPTTVYDEDGTPMSISMIAVKYTDMVNDGTLKYIDSLSTKQYFSNNFDSPDFLPLIQNFYGDCAGQIIRGNSNYHRCITGKSGSGKTVFLMQLMARLSLMGNRVIVFDNSNSFSKTELENTLSKEFIDEHITFYDASTNGLPVHLLYTYEQDSHLKQRNMLTSIIGEAMHNATTLQLILLKKIIMEYIKTSNCSYMDFYKMFYCIEMNKNEKKIRDGVLNKIGMIIEELVESDSDANKDDWFTFLDKCKDIVIINIEESGGSNGSQLTDMLIASLFQAHLHQSEYNPLCMFIDEIQNQNLSKGSVISRIIREGRKYLISLNYATQYISGTEISKLLSQASLNVCFRPEINSLKSVAEMLGFSKKDVWKLNNMNVGECFIQGNFINFETGERDETVIHGKTLLLPDSPLNNTK